MCPSRLPARICSKVEIFAAGMLEFWALLLWVLAWDQVHVEGVTSSSDVSSLNVLYTSLNSPPQLTSWSSNGGDPCGQSWKGITCSGSVVTEVSLPGLGLNGSLGYKLTDMVSLINLDVHNNNIGAGDQLPYGFPPNVQRLDLSGNLFGGGLPYSFSQMSSLTYLNVGHNNLQGSLNDMFSNHSRLLTMDLSFNNFSGTLPQSFSSLSSLTSLYLENNQFTGSVDVLIKLPLVNLNIMGNKFNASVPDELKHIKNFQGDNISWGSGFSPLSPPQHPSSSGSNRNPGQRSSGKINAPNQSGIGIGGIAGICAVGLFIGFLIAYFIIRRTRKVTKKREKTIEIDQPQEHSLYETHETKSDVTFLHMDPTSIQVEPNVNLKPPPVDQHNSFSEEDSINKSIMPKNFKVPANASPYSVADLQLATGSFSSDNLIGEGSFGRVYCAQFDDGKIAAVKKINSSALPNQTPEYFLDMVTRLSQLHHPNVNKLIGYCCEHGQYLLVFDYQKNGSLQDLLHMSDEYSRPLTWNIRVKIALGTARALEYLHEVCSPSVVHRNFKSANILLDNEFNPYLSDCGFSNLVLNTEYQASDKNMGFGYSAPEVVMSGQYTLKSDVYSFGVVMLELLTARKPFDSLRPRSEQSLVRWATPQLHDIDALDKMVDPALKGHYPAKSLSRFADVIALCVQPEPEFRPPMSEVVQALVRLVQRANMSRRMGSAEDLETCRRTDDADRHDVC